MVDCHALRIDQYRVSASFKIAWARNDIFYTTSLRVYNTEIYRVARRIIKFSY